MRSPLRKQLLHIAILYTLLVMFGEGLFIGYLYIEGSATVDYPHAQMEAHYHVQTGDWTQQQADSWLQMHAQRFWDEVWTRSRSTLLLATLVAIVIVAGTGERTIRRLRLL